MSICVLDTSVFVELLDVPGMNQQKAELTAELKAKLSRRELLLLPLVTIVESGNHIGQRGDGRERRAAAGRFGAQVRLAISGDSPFVTSPMPEAENIIKMLDDFPDWANRGSGFGDLAIRDVYEKQCELHPGRRVYVWSLDKHLSALNREP